MTPKCSRVDHTRLLNDQCFEYIDYKTSTIEKCHVLMPQSCMNTCMPVSNKIQFHLETND